MGTIECVWKPTPKSVERKNTKLALAWALIDIWTLVDDLEDSDEKQEIIKRLLLVL